MNVCVFMWRPEIDLQSFPILFFVFCARISHRWNLPEQARQIGQPQGATFLCHTRAKVYKYTPPLGLSHGVYELNPNSQVCTMGTWPTELIFSPTLS